MRHWILVTVAAAGCGGAVPTVPRPSKPASIEPLAPQPGSYRLARPLSPIELPIDPRLGLAATLTPRWPIRAWPRPDSVGGVTDGAGPLALSSLQSLPVVALDADRMRVVAESNGLRLLLWSPRTSFAPVVTRELAASARPDGPSPRVFESGVFVAPGLRVTYRRGAWWHINGINGLRLDAWIPDTAVADWYSPGLEPVERTQADRIAARTVVRARASDASAIVATFDAEHSIEVSHTHGDWVEIDARFVGVRVHGFVNRDSVTRWSPLAARASGGYGPYGSYGGGGEDSEGGDAPGHCRRAHGGGGEGSEGGDGAGHCGRAGGGGGPDHSDLLGSGPVSYRGGGEDSEG